MSCPSVRATSAARMLSEARAVAVCTRTPGCRGISSASTATAAAARRRFLFWEDGCTLAMGRVLQHGSAACLRYGSTARLRCDSVSPTTRAARRMRIQTRTMSDAVCVVRVEQQPSVHRLVFARSSSGRDCTRRSATCTSSRAGTCSGLTRSALLTHAQATDPAWRSCACKVEHKGMAGPVKEKETSAHLYVSHHTETKVAVANTLLLV
ncbi:hypothetical protein B0H19DRAFT_1068371 [Mycena capillaripes]|nr:hypothetical protein B0H19DRAFT_1068371 [Mycena capillaripes]